MRLLLIGSCVKQEEQFHADESLFEKIPLTCSPPFNESKVIIFKILIDRYLM